MCEESLRNKVEARIPWSVAGAVAACYDCSTADAGYVFWVEVEAGKLHGGHCVDGSGWVVGEVERPHEVGVPSHLFLLMKEGISSNGMSDLMKLLVKANHGTKGRSGNVLESAI